MALEDLAMMRAIEGSMVLYPSDAVATENAVRIAAENHGIVYIRTSRPKTPVIYSKDEPFELGRAKVIRESADDKAAIVTSGAGNYAAFLHRYHAYKGWRSGLSPTSGSMGYGLPAAIAAKIAHPERTVVNFAGDGCFMMTAQELATCMQYQLPIVTVVVNNGMFGTIRMHQEREYPRRVNGTSLVNPDFAAFARAFGAHGETVTRTADFKPAFERALASGKPAIVEVKTDPEAIAVTRTITQLRGGT